MTSLPSQKIDWQEVWQKARIPVTLGMIGLLLVGIGVLSILFLQSKEPEIEILPLEETQSTNLFVDLEGAVEKPGLYELAADARINDVLVRAGGLSAEADREWVEKNLNLAQPLADGIKIYIPKKGEGAGEPKDAKVAGSSASLTGQININTASAAQLDTLWGIGQARAQNIIDSRPYQAAEELLTKKIIPSNVFERIKDKISVY